jgi:carboxyl-terminal processing protease
MSRTPRPPHASKASPIAGLIGLVLLLRAGPDPHAAQEARPKPAAPAKAVETKKADKATGLTAEQKAKNIESFEVVWRTVRDRHFDPKLGGLDWQAVHDELRPKVERAKTNAEARDVITAALERLGQTHFAIIPSELEKDLDNPKQGPGVLGLDVRLLDGRVVVTAVPEGLPAALAGVKPGWIVQKVDGKPVDEILKAAGVAYAKTRQLVPMYKIRAVDSRLHARVGSVIPVDFLDEKDKPVHRDLKAREPAGVPVTFGHLPTFYVRFVTKRIDRTVAYMSLNVFFDAVNVLKQFGEAIEANRDADGLIIDLRGNPGGMGAMSFALGGWLVVKPGLKLGTMITRSGSLNFTLFPRPRPYEKPVAILVDELSMSTAEILAGGLRDIGRARIFGTKTPGAALPSLVVLLPNGDRFQFAIANYLAAGGQPLEGEGVRPDVETPLTRTALLEGRDPAIKAAVGWIRSVAAPHSPNARP